MIYKHGPVNLDNASDENDQCQSGRSLFSRLIRSERGLSLAELMVTMGMLAVSMTVVYGSYLAMNSFATISDNRVIALQDARLGIDRLTKDLRVAEDPGASFDAIASADKSLLTFYANVNKLPGPEKITYRILNGNLRKEIVNPTGTVDAWVYNGSKASLDIASYNRNSTTATADWLFTYWASTDATVDIGSAVNVPLNPLPLSSANRNRVTLIKIKLILDKTVGKSPSRVALETSVALRNFKK